MFVDAVHTNYAGLRLQAWVTFNQLLPTVEKHFADGSWPRPRDPRAAAPHNQAPQDHLRLPLTFVIDRILV